MVPATWCADIAAMLSERSEASPREIAAFEIMVTTKAAFLHRLDYLGERIGYVVTRFDQEADGISIVVCSAVALPIKGLCVSTYLHDVYSELAAGMGARSLRFFTKRAGLKRKMERLGYETRFEMERSFDGQ